MSFVRTLRRFTVLAAVALVAASLTAYAGIAAFLYSRQDAIIFRQNTRTIYDPTAPANMQRLTLRAADGTTLHGVLLPPGTSRQRSAPPAPPRLLLAFGGNGQDAGTFALFLRDAVFPNENLTVAAFNYRGYSSRVMPASAGTPSQAALYADALTELDTLRGNLKPAQTYLLGYSLGTSMAAYAASQRPEITGLALIAPFSSIRAIGQARFPYIPVAWLLRNPFPTLDYIGHVTAPTSIFYAEHDRLIPAGHAQTLARELSRTDYLREISVIPGTGHVSILENASLIRKLRTAILSQAQETPGQRPGV